MKNLVRSTRCLSTILVKKMDTIGVVGAGQMGTGIALVAARNADMKILCYDVDWSKLNGSMEWIRNKLYSYGERGNLDKSKVEEIISRITPCKRIEDLGDAPLIVEAASERESLKLEIFKSLDKITDSEAILVSNTSSISITKIGSATSKPEKVVGMHFFNPVQHMQVVELTPVPERKQSYALDHGFNKLRSSLRSTGLETDESTIEATKSVCERMGKVVGTVKDSPGFISNRVLMPYINEAINTFSEGVATPEEIDMAIVGSSTKKMGPLATADLIGLDTCLAIMRVLHSHLGDDKYRPAPLLASYVHAGRLGRKSGRGFYTYDS
eukprot:CAMPEP_0184742430 /NCGR_PEP_ID=MMETSP0315-20130426/5341_1 /TAXON_ID=101924 /ORGANISM="Rhodosorus marinus, Strain UTEX LB 2760" /LENGTH=325 /DNA_ID=CAMNT_0027213199 /DNA_START=172 /DNA_END=1150 /DNA_ORIENTATION=+